MMHQPLINPHRWETIVLHSPDFQPIGQIMTNGFVAPRTGAWIETTKKMITEPILVGKGRLNERDE
jgi:hypothetical protein